MKLFNEDELIQFIKNNYSLISVDEYDIKNLSSLGEFHLHFFLPIHEMNIESIPSYFEKCLGEKYDLLNKAKGVLSYFVYDRGITFADFDKFSEFIHGSVSDDATVILSNYSSSPAIENALHVYLFGVPFENGLDELLRSVWKGTEKEFDTYINNRRIRAIFS